LLWFLFVGWWAGQIWIAIAWFFMLTIIGIPFGVTMFNVLPKVMALRQPKQTVITTVSTMGNVTVVNSSSGQLPQVNILIRIVYFILIGWWLSALWVEIAYFVCLTIIGLPIGLLMIDKTPGIVSLRR
jgi:uncharacterized membrane protein YccF (DUF307 family)